MEKVEKENKEFAESVNKTKETLNGDACEEASSDKESNTFSDEANTENEASEPKTQSDEDLNTKYLRLMADFQNFRKRTEKQKSEIYAFANEGIVLKLIDVVDSFERALMIEPNTDSEKALKDGMELVFKQLLDALKASGVELIEDKGVEFDPNIHNAVMMEDTTEVESGQVSEVLQKGYTLNGRVLRAAMVKVAN